MLIVLARASDETSRPCTCASGAFGSAKFKSVHNATFVTGLRARDGARIQTTAHKLHSSGCPKGRRTYLRA